MFVVICYLNTVKCIWTNLCEVISISSFSVQNNLLMRNGLFYWNYWSVLLDLCLFAIQNYFLTFIKVLVNRTWLMDWLRCAILDRPLKKVPIFYQNNKDRRSSMGKDDLTIAALHIIKWCTSDGMLLLFGQDLFELRFVLVCRNFQWRLQDLEIRSETMSLASD